MMRGRGLSSLSFAPSPEMPVSGFDRPINVQNSFGSDGSLSSVLPMRGTDIGPAPDFWGDLRKMMMVGPPAQKQATAMRHTARPKLSSPGERNSNDFQSNASFGNYTFPGGSGVLNPYDPKKLQSPGNAPFATRA